MSNIFAPWVRTTGRLPIDVGSGPIVDGVKNQHLWFNSDEEILASNDAIHHYGDALPFDVNGRLVVSESPVDYWDQDIPFTASGAVAVVEYEPDYWDQGVAFIVTGHIASGSGIPTPEPPVWSQIPDVWNYQYELPQTYDVSRYVSSILEPITSYALIAPPPGFTIDQDGVITADGAAVGDHLITVEACNATGCSQTTFTWTITLGTTPTWDPIPNQTNRVNELPKTLNVNSYVTSDSGPILSISLVNPPAGFTILTGTVTASAGVAVGTYVLVVRAANGVGYTDTSFTWDILEELLGPQWGVIPDQTNSQADLPDTFDVSPYVTSNAGALFNWTLVTPPPGFTISQAGVVSVEAGTAIAVHSIVVSVSNSIGSASSSFSWNVVADLLPPIWQTIPDQTTGENLLPAIFNVSPYVSSNSGPLTGWSLISPPAGISISGSGVITVDGGTDVGVYALTVEVSNDTGTSQSSVFSWEITLYYLPPQWSAIPDQITEDDDLPDTLDVSPYVTTNSGPLTGWALVGAPAGFTISAAGVVTCGLGTAVGPHEISVLVSNDEGDATSSSFTWTVTDILLPPVWSTVPDQTTREDALPDALDLTAFVTSNNGALTGWELVSPPAGFTINTAGLLTVAVGVAPAGYTLQVRVSNTSGETSSNVFGWTIGAFYLPPQWSTIPDQATEEQLLPVVLDVKPYVTSNHGTLTGWSLVSPPSGWTISTDGIITVASGRATGSYSISVRVGNDTGVSDSDSFTWEILEEPLPPQWSTIPGRQDRENTLPQNYDITSYVDSNAGTLSGWELVAPPAGFTISGAGVITAQAGTTVAIHTLTVRVSNDEGNADAAPFQWEILEELIPPVWSTIPDQTDRVNTLPQQLATSPYVTSNNGDPFSWAINGPAGFSIDNAGVITADGAAVAVHTLSVQVSNLTGPATSPDFTWTILEELLPPVWVTIPNKTTANLDLPDTYDVSGFVSSNSGPLDTWSLVSPPTGFTINQSGVITAATSATVAANGITVRVYNDTGSSDKSFTWTVEPPAQQNYYHEFNADLDSWNYAHVGTVEIIDTNNTRVVVPDGEAPYLGVAYSGTTPVPNAGFEGILIEHESTNEVLASETYTVGPWDGSWMQIEGKNFNGVINNANAFCTGTALLTNTDISIYARVNGNGGAGSFLLTYNDTLDGQAVEVTLPGDNVWQIVENVVNAGTIRPTVATTGASGDRNFNMDFMQGENVDYPSSYMGPTGSGSTVTRAASTCSKAFTDMGIDPANVRDHFSGQIKFYMRQSPNVDGRVCGFFGDSSNYFRIAYDEGNSRWEINIRESGVDHFVFHNATFSYGDFFNFSFKRTPTQVLKVWLNNSLIGTNTDSVAAWGSDVVTHAFVGTAYGGSDVRNANSAINSFRLVTGEVDDSVVGGWS